MDLEPRFRSLIIAVAEKIKAGKIPFHLGCAQLAQACLESGYGKSHISEVCNNFWGMKWRDVMAEVGAESLYVETDTEPSGGAYWCKFKDAEHAFRGYWRFVERSPYKGWEEHSATAADFLAHIGPVWCSVGYKPEWLEDHGGSNYHQHIMNRFYHKCEDWLRTVGGVSEQKKVLRGDFYRPTVTNRDARLFLVEDPGGTVTEQMILRDYNDIESVIALFTHAQSKGVETVNFVADGTPEPKAGEPLLQTPKSQPAYPGYYLSIGSRGDKVRLVQKAVGVIDDGIFGEITRNAVITFQSAHGLNPDGLVGPKTWQTMFPGSGTVNEADPTDNWDWDANDEIDRPSRWERNAKLLWVPWAEIRHDMPTAWNYPEGGPEGLILHFDAGSSAEGSYSYLKQQGYCTMVLDRDGEQPRLIQGNPLSRGGPHCGTWHHRRYVGLEVHCEGKLTKMGGVWKSWFKRTIPTDKIRESGRNENIQPGHYRKYEMAQIEEIVKLCIWLNWNFPQFSLDNVLGHDEVTDRKNDPGASLGQGDEAWNMSQFRAMLKEQYAEFEASMNE